MDKVSVGRAARPYEERMCHGCLSGRVYDGRTGARVACGTCEGCGRARVFIYPKPSRFRTCSGYSGRFAGRGLFEVWDDHLTLFEHDEICGSCARHHRVA